MALPRTRIKSAAVPPSHIWAMAIPSRKGERDVFRTCHFAGKFKLSSGNVIYINLRVTTLCLLWIVFGLIGDQRWQVRSGRVIVRWSAEPEDADCIDNTAVHSQNRYVISNNLTGTRLVKFWTKFKKSTALSAKWWHISCAIHIDGRQPRRAFSQKLERIFCRPYDTQLRSRICYSVASVVSRLSVTLCIVAKRCVLEQKLPLTAYRKSYEKSIGSKMNDLDHCLEVVSRSCQPLHFTCDVEYLGNR